MTKDAAFSGADRAEQAAAHSGSQRALAMAALITGCLQLYYHRWDLALVAAQRALVASKTPFTLGPACALFALAQIATGQAAAAASMLQSIWEQLGSNQPRTFHVALMLLFAEALLRSGSPERAQPIALDALRIADAHKLFHIGFAFRALGLAELRLGRRARARKHLVASVVHHEAVGIPAALALSLRALAELEREQSAAQALASLARAHGLYVTINHAEGASAVREQMRCFEQESHAQLDDSVSGE